MSAVQAESPRRGGREARRALRAAPLAMNERPVWPGMSGGHFKVMSDTDVQRIHQAALDVLASLGEEKGRPSRVQRGDDVVEDERVARVVGSQASVQRLDPSRA